MSNCSSISEEIETSHLQDTSDVEPHPSRSGDGATYTFSDFESTTLTHSGTSDKEDSSCPDKDSPNIPQDHLESSQCSNSASDHDSQGESPSNTLARSRDFDDSSASGEFYSKKLAILKGNTNTYSTLQETDSSCHGYQNTTHKTSLGHDFFMQRLQSNRKKTATPPLVETANPSPKPPAQILMERLPVATTERLRLEALIHRMTQMVEEVSKELRDDDCSECKAQLKVLAEKEFISKKLKMLTEPSLLKRLDEHLYQKDSITLLGEVVRSCVRPSASGEDIWQALAEKLDSLQHEAKRNKPN